MMVGLDRVWLREREKKKLSDYERDRVSKVREYLGSEVGK